MIKLRSYRNNDGIKVLNEFDDKQISDEIINSFKQVYDGPAVGIDTMALKDPVIELIGQLYFKTLNEFPEIGVPIKKNEYGYEIDVYYLGERIQIYQPELYSILWDWREKLKSLKK